VAGTTGEHKQAPDGVMEQQCFSYIEDNARRIRQATSEQSQQIGWRNAGNHRPPRKLTVVKGVQVPAISRKMAA
jgi:hypothetical protein